MCASKQDSRIRLNRYHGKNKSKSLTDVTPVEVEKFIVSDEDKKNFPKNLPDFIARCEKIEKNLSKSGNSEDFAKVIFKFFRDSDMINEENIKLLTDDEFCQSSFDCEKSILKLDKADNYFEHMLVMCKENRYYILKNCWYVQTEPKSSQEFYKWILEHAWKKFEQIKSKDIRKDIAECIKSESVIQSKYLSEFFSGLVVEELEKSNLDKATGFYALAFKLGDAEPLKILQLAKFYGEEKISDEILNYIRRNLDQIKTEDIFKRVVDFVEKNKSEFQLKYLSEIFSKLAEKMEKQEDLNRAIEFYKLAIKFDDKNSLKILQLAKIYEKSGRFNDAFRQYSSLKNTSQQEQAADRINLMGCNFNSKKDYKSAEICFERAANMVNASAMNNLGCYLIEGRGTRRNEEEGFDWLYKAAYEFGHIEAKSNLERYLESI